MDKKKVLQDSSLNSYFKESLFLDGIFHPDGSNIAPKSDWNQDLTTGYKYNYSGYGCLDYKIQDVDYDSTSLKVEGEFLITEYKDYSYYWDMAIENSRFLEQKIPFHMKDNGTFSSRIVFSEDILIINTDVCIIRNAFGYNYDGKSIRDGMFPNLKHDDGRGKFHYEEYYQLLSNGERLLHYSINSDFFEVYKLSKNWNFQDGITNLHSKVFDDITYDLMDEDLMEMLEIINNSRKNNNKSNLVRVRKKMG